MRNTERINAKKPKTKLGAGDKQNAAEVAPAPGVIWPAGHEVHDITSEGSAQAGSEGLLLLDCDEE